MQGIPKHYEEVKLREKARALAIEQDMSLEEAQRIVLERRKQSDALLNERAEAYRELQKFRELREEELWKRECPYMRRRFTHEIGPIRILRGGGANGVGRGA